MMLYTIYLSAILCGIALSLHCHNLLRIKSVQFTFCLGHQFPIWKKSRLLAELACICQNHRISGRQLAQITFPQLSLGLGGRKNAVPLAVIQGHKLWKPKPPNKLWKLQPPEELWKTKMVLSEEMWAGKSLREVPTSKAFLLAKSMHFEPMNKVRMTRIKGSIYKVTHFFKWPNKGGILS